MKQITKILGLATVIGLCAVPVVQAYDDWITPGLWNWVLETGAPKIAEYGEAISTLTAENAALELEVDELQQTVAGLSAGGQAKTATLVPRPR